MNTEISDALQRINTIQETIEDAKVHYRGMYLMCFLLGLYNILRYILGMTFLLHPAWKVCLSVSVYVLPVLLLAGYICIYKSEKKYSNKYYLSLICIWGIVAIAIPVSAMAVNLLQFLFGAKDNSAVNGDGLLFASFAANFSGILLFSVFMVVCAYSLNKRYMVGLAVAGLFGYMLLTSFLGNADIPFPFIPGQPEARMPYHSLYYNAVTCVGYFVLGFYIRHKEQGEAGDEHR